MAEEPTTIAEDMLDGIPAISNFTGIPPRKCYYAAAQGLLPGVWKEGSKYRGLKSVIRETWRTRALAGIPAKKGAA